MTREWPRCQLNFAFWIWKVSLIGRLVTWLPPKILSFASHLLFPQSKDIGSRPNEGRMRFTRSYQTPNTTNTEEKEFECCACNNLSRLLAKSTGNTHTNMNVHFISCRVPNSFVSKPLRNENEIPNSFVVSKLSGPHIPARYYTSIQIRRELRCPSLWPTTSVGHRRGPDY